MSTDERTREVELLDGLIDQVLMGYAAGFTKPHIKEICAKWLAPAVQPEAQVVERARRLVHDIAYAPRCSTEEGLHSLACDEATNAVLALVTRECNAARLAALEQAAGVAENCWQPRKDIATVIRALAAKEQPLMKRLPCGCLANNLSRCPVHDAP